MIEDYNQNSQPSSGEQQNKILNLQDKNLVYMNM